MRRENGLTAHALAMNTAIAQQWRAQSTGSQRRRFAAGFILALLKLWPQVLKIDFLRHADGVAVPCLLMADVDDYICPASLIRELSEALPPGQASLVVSEKLGHRPHWMDTGAFIGHVRAWLAQIDAVSVQAA